jgi:hypothetical protein
MCAVATAIESGLLSMQVSVHAKPTRCSTLFECREPGSPYLADSKALSHSACFED